MAEQASTQASAEVLQRDIQLVADLASSWMVADTEKEIYAGLAEGLQQVVGEDALINVSNYDPEGQVFRSQALVGLGPIADKIVALLGKKPLDLEADYPASVKQAFKSGLLSRIEGGVVELAGEVIPPAICGQAERLFGLDEVLVVGFAKGSFKGGICFITRRPGAALRKATIETLARVAAVAVESRRTRTLRDNEERYKSLIERSLDIVYVHDFDGRFVDANHTALDWLGYTKDELRSLGFASLLTEDQRQLAREAMQEIRETGAQAGRSEFTLRRKDGTDLFVETKGFAVVRDGRPVAVLGIARDITESRRAQQEKARLEDKLQQAQKMESVGRLAGGVAHDFNNMLGVILGQAEIAMTQVDPSQPLCSNLNEIKKAALRSADLTRQLLAFARKQTVTPKVLDLNETIAGMLDLLRRLIGEDVNLRWRPGADLWPVEVDPSQIDQILANLCVNSRDAISGVGNLTIETTNRTVDKAWCAVHAEYMAGEFVQLCVSDDGSGMDEEAQAHLFEPFFTTKEVGKGTGLGLATVYGVVKQNNGFITVFSEVGMGTVFKIYLPRHTGEARQAGAKGAALPAKGGRETILLVEDEPAVLRATGEMLEQLGYTVVEAGTPGEAMRLANEHAGKIDLLLTDVIMPEMNGRDLSRRLLALQPRLKQLLMSGHTADVIAHHGVLDEGVNFIPKPFSAGDLAAKVRATLDGPATAS